MTSIAQDAGVSTAGEIAHGRNGRNGCNGRKTGTAHGVRTCPAVTP
ncbi:hypothetical protein [Streptomyces sp. Y7]